MADILKFNPDILQVNDDGAMTPGKGFDNWVRQVDPDITGMIIAALTYHAPGERTADAELRDENRDELDSAAEWALLRDIRAGIAVGRTYPDHEVTQAAGPLETGMDDADKLIHDYVQGNQTVGAAV